MRDSGESLQGGGCRVKYTYYKTWTIIELFFKIILLASYIYAHVYAYALRPFIEERGSTVKRQIQQMKKCECWFDKTDYNRIILHLTTKRFFLNMIFIKRLWAWLESKYAQDFSWCYFYLEIQCFLYLKWSWKILSNKWRYCIIFNRSGPEIVTLKSNNKENSTILNLRRISWPSHRVIWWVNFDVSTILSVGGNANLHQ